MPGRAERDDDSDNVKRALRDAGGLAVLEADGEFSDSMDGHV
jgi:hypothetical protein